MAESAANAERRLIFVDTETTGLDPATEKLTELAYAFETGEVKTLYFGVTEVNEYIDKLTHYYARGIDKIAKSSDDEFNEFLRISKGNTMVAANPGFDSNFLEAAGLFNFSYRKLDIESYAMKALNLEYVPGMKQIHTILKDHGYDIAEPNHTAAGDVIAMRQMFLILRSEFEVSRPWL